MRNQLTSNQWNWGAFLLCPFWCIRYQVWIGVISIFPVILISLMSLISLGSFSLLILSLKSKLPSLLSGIISVFLFCLLYISGNIFLLMGKNTTIGIVISLYVIGSVIMGFKGDKMVLEKMSETKDIQKFNFEKKGWLLLGLLFSMPTNIILFYLTEKSVSISIDLIQLPGI